MEWVEQIKHLLKIEIQEILHIPWRDIQFETLDIALGITVMLVIFLAFKKSRARQRYFRQHSGHSTFSSKSSKSWVTKTFRKAETLFVAVGVSGLIIALAKPVIYQENTYEIARPRERLEIIDESASMCFAAGPNRKSIGETARDAHLRFLKKRRGYNDIVSLWLFSFGAYKVSDFIRDDAAHAFFVSRAPYAISSFKNIESLEKHIVCSHENIDFIDDEGGTNLQHMLQVAIEYFDSHGNPRISQKALLMITDAATETYPEEELKRLQKRKIIPYILFIEPNPVPINVLNIGQIENSRRLIRELSNYGGRYFYASNPASIDALFTEIHKLESAQHEVKIDKTKISLFFHALILALVCFLAACALHFIEDLLFPQNP